MSYKDISFRSIKDVDSAKACGNLCQEDDQCRLYGPTGFTTLTVTSRHPTPAGLLMQTEPLDRNLVNECLIGCRGSFQTTIYGYRLYSELIICLNLDNVEILLNLRFLTSIKAKKNFFHNPFSSSRSQKFEKL